MDLSTVFRVLLASCVMSIGCTSNSSTEPTTKNDHASVPEQAPVAAITPAPQEDGPLRFADRAASAGLRFRHYSPLTSQRHIHLFMGSGIGWLDFDRDGWPDLYCCQGAAYESATAETVSDLLYRNTGDGSFVDVTDRTGLWNDGYSMGMAAADYDNDGFVDLCVTGYGENFLFHNQGDGCFQRVSLPEGVSAGRLSASCAWGDIDADGNLDLFITNYAQLGPRNYPTCEHTVGAVTIPISCHPINLEAVPDLLYHNLGDGAFEDISVEVGIRESEPRAGLGVIAADLDADGDIDFYVANDTTDNHLWENQGDGRFSDRGDVSGTSRNRYGAREAGMGLVAGDLTGQGRLDLFVTNYYAETNTMYRNDGRLLFADVTEEVGLAAPSRLRLGFGTSLADFDNDCWLDLIIANGHVQDRLAEIERDEPFAQLPLLFHSVKGLRFEDVTAGAGEYFRRPHVGRGTAVADYDGDGRADVAVNSLNDDVALLRNALDNQASWIRLELVGTSCNRGAVGAILLLDLGDQVLTRVVHAGAGYLSSDEATMLVGLGPRDEVRQLRIVWPGGRSETWSSLRANQLWRLVEGTGDGWAP